MKALGALSILLASLLGALSLLREEKRQISDMIALRDSLRLLGRDLGERQRELRASFEVLSDRVPSATVRGFYASACKQMDKLGEEDFADLWSLCVQEQLAPLGESCMETLRGLGNVLGASELESQCAALDAAAADMEERAAARQARLSDRRKITLGVSMSLGAFVVILLI